MRIIGGSPTSRAASNFSVAYNIVEGLVSVGLGVKEGSIAMAGFGADSFIEVASARGHAAIPKNQPEFLFMMGCGSVRSKRSDRRL